MVKSKDEEITTSVSQGLANTISSEVKSTLLSLAFLLGENLSLVDDDIFSNISCVINWESQNREKDLLISCNLMIMFAIQIL